MQPADDWKRQTCLEGPLKNAFLEWLILPETESQLDALLSVCLTEAKQTTDDHLTAPNLLSVPPPPSPSLDLLSPHRVQNESLPSALRESSPRPPSVPLAPVVGPSSRSVIGEDDIPRFYTPSRSIPKTGASASEIWTEAVESAHMSSLGLTSLSEDTPITFEQFEMKIVKELLRISRYTAVCLYSLVNGLGLEQEELERLLHAINGKGPQVKPIKFGQWKRFWISRALVLDNEIWNFFSVIKEEDNDFIWAHNFQPFLLELLERHPGVDFLKPTPEFQKKFSETVIIRICYELDAMVDHKIVYSQLIRSCLVNCWNLLDDEQDFNAVKEFFSYEHFYVMYCRFWTLDYDHDFRLDRSDLMRYDNHAFSQLTLNRLFSEAGPLMGDGHSVSYEGFVYLLIHDEDKTTDRSIEFWFRILDLDGDGVLRPSELGQFYSQQLARLESRTMDAPSFEVVLCQLSDAIRPEIPNEFRLKDLRRNRRHAPLFFNTLLSLTKLIAWEHRDPFMQKAEFMEFPFHTDWDRFCHLEYEKISTEDVSDEVGSFHENDYQGRLLGDQQRLLGDGPSAGRFTFDDEVEC